MAFSKIAAENLGGSTLPALAAGNLTGISAGITEADQWRVTSSFSGNTSPIASNWERNDQAFDKIGTGWSQSSGIFTAPSTGIYLVKYITTFSKSSGDSQWVTTAIEVTTNNSSYTPRATNYGFINEAGGETYGNGYAELIVDVTNTTNVKVRFTATNQSSVDWYGDTNEQRVGVTFVRLGDT